METPRETMHSAVAAAVPPAAPRKVVTVFGASWCKPGDALYTESETLGRLLAESGYGILNGGYAGTMEGSAKGATAAGGTATGVIVPELFKNRAGGNEFLSKSVAAPTLLTRIEAMIDGADYFVVMQGTLGTLTELAAINNIAALASIGHYTAPFIVVYRVRWVACVASDAPPLHVPHTLAWRSRLPTRLPACLPAPRFAACSILGRRS